MDYRRSVSTEMGVGGQLFLFYFFIKKSVVDVTVLVRSELFDGMQPTRVTPTSTTHRFCVLHMDMRAHTNPWSACQLCMLTTAI